MTEPQARLCAALLARKGHAVPLGAAAAGTAPAQAPTALSDAGEVAPATGPAGAAPAASLLPLDFLAQRQGSLDLALLSPEASETGSAPVLDAAPEAPAPSGNSETPRAVPALRIDAGTKLASPPEPWRFPALAAGVALALVLGATAYAYKIGWLEPQAPADAQGSEAAPPPQQETDTAVAPAGAPSATPSEVPAGASPGTSPAAPSETASDPGAEAGQSSEPDQTSEAARPSVDVVRIEADGAAVIAGRAAPGAELILLDNGRPIGTAQADSYGEWVFIPIDPLPSGAHDFGLVIKKIEGGISVPPLDKMPSNEDAAAPGVPSPNEPGTARGAAATVPIPPRKPETETAPAAAAPAAAFAVQLASVKTRGGAEREWRALRRRFPEILSALTLSLDEAKLAGGDSVVRLRTGTFVKLGEAAALCERLAVKHQDCLVVRTAANIRPTTPVRGVALGQ